MKNKKALSEADRRALAECDEIKSLLEGTGSTLIGWSGPNEFTVGDHRRSHRYTGLAVDALRQRRELRQACEQCLPDWWQEAINDGRKGDGEICCEITYGDVRALVAALKKAEVK